MSIWRYFLKNYLTSTDMVVENIVSFPMLTPLVSRRKSKVAIVHHLTGWEYLRSQGLVKGAIGIVLEKVILPVVYKNVKIITVSDLSKRDLVGNGVSESAVEVIPPGINTVFFSKGIKSDSPLIVYVGRYDGQRGTKKVDHLIKAFAIVSRRIPKCKLIIAGPKKHSDELRQMSVGLPVEFLGYVSEEEKRNLLRQAWVFASPSLKEGFGITFIEANACGTPVVGYTLEGLDTVPSSSGILVPPNDIDGLADAMANLILDSSLRTSMEQSAVQNSKRFSSQMFSSRIRDLLNENVGVGEKR